MSKEALRLADALDGDFRDDRTNFDNVQNAAAELRRLAALNAELVEAAEDYLDAQGAVDNRELMGPNAPPYEELWRKRSSAYAAFEATLSKAKEF